MRYAIHQIGTRRILQTLDAPESVIAEITPPGCVAVPVGIEVSDATHIIVDGVPVPCIEGSEK